MASDDLRARIAEALREAPVHATVMRLDVVTDVYGPADAQADAAMTVVTPELERLRRELDDARSELYQLRTRPAVSASTPLICSDERHQAKVAALQGELDRAQAELHRHATCAVCGHERHRHGYEPIIRRDWCGDCPTASDLHTFQAKESLS